MRLPTPIIAIVLLLTFIKEERTRSYNQYLSTRAKQKPLKQPVMDSPSKYSQQTIRPTQQPVSKYSFITSTTATSKYTPEQLQSFYKINPYTNL